VRLVIDADPGNGRAGSNVDDALAIALALRSPEVELLAVTVVAVDDAVQAALTLLKAGGAGHVPVHRGAVRPLLQDSRPWRALLDTRRNDLGASGSGPTARLPRRR